MNMNRAAFVLMIAAALAVAQDPGRLTVPFSNPSGPKTVRIDTFNGNVTVRGYAGNEVIVETKQGRAPRRRPPRDLEGLKRIDVSGSDILIEERENVVTITSPAHRGGDDIVVQVPATTALRVKSMNGDITVEGVHGSLELNTTSGEVKATGVEGSVIAHSLNGEITVVLDKYDGKPMSFSTLNGEIDVTLPADTRARLKMKADHGEVYSDFDMTLEPTTRKLDQGDAKTGRRRVSIERVVYANINGGGPEIAFTTLNGEIKIRRKK